MHFCCIRKGYNIYRCNCYTNKFKFIYDDLKYRLMIEILVNIEEINFI